MYTCYFLVTFSSLFRNNMSIVVCIFLKIEVFFKINKTASKKLIEEENGLSKNEEFEAFEKVIFSQ